jgi:hypothetical protein
MVICAGTVLLLGDSRQSTSLLLIAALKVHKNENFFGFDFEFCTISLSVMSKYKDFAKKTF